MLDLLKRAAYVLAESPDTSEQMLRLRRDIVDMIKAHDPAHYGLPTNPEKEQHND